MKENEFGHGVFFRLRQARLISTNINASGEQIIDSGCIYCTIGQVGNTEWSCM